MIRVLVLLAVMVGALGEGETKKVFNTPIKHVVLLMEENRSFDHLLGYLPGVDGLKGTEAIPLNTLDPKGPVVRVGNTSDYISQWGPCHNFTCVREQIFGNKGIAEGMTVATMDGFAEQEHHGHSDPSLVMNMFTPDRVPIISTLAKEFAVFDRYFCSVPGPTWPNRLFQLMGTSQGCTKTKVWHPDTFLYTGKTIFDSMVDAGHDWGFYYADAPLEMAMLESVALHPTKVHNWERFHKDVREGHLPAFSWVNPRWGVNKTSGEGCNSQHPDHDVRLGEALMKEVYEALRAGPKWNETLFIITYDEHGGYYDHVPTPLNIPAPDDSKSYPDDFDFTRGGVRIPTLLISPWLRKGTVIGKPDGPQPNSEYETTSVLSSMKEMFGLHNYLTKRDAWAGSFAKHLTDLDEPRTDCPTHWGLSMLQLRLPSPSPTCSGRSLSPSHSWRG